VQKLKPGDLVRVRRARWRVVDTRPYDACQIITLSSADPASAGVERRVIDPFDAVERIARPVGVRLVHSRRWRRACRELLAANAPPGALRSARHARMDLLPHQLAPALAILRGLGSRVLLADDVGLGKTVQAGLVAAELRARGWADRILILTPAGLREQWAAELAQRLAIGATIVDTVEIRRRVATLPVGVNPWTTIPIAISSVDYVKRPEVAPAISAARWDIVIIDEAHGVAGDSDRYHAATMLASGASYVLLLTATPHSGDRRGFAALSAIGAQGGDPLLVFRRTRHDVRPGTARHVHRLHVRPSAAEARMHALLADFTRAVRKEHGDHAALALSVLHKRALSSARSLEQSVERRLAALAVTRTTPMDPLNPVHDDADALQLALPLDDESGELTPGDRPPAWGSDLGLADASRERQLLDSLRDAARAASVDETKVRVLARLLRRIDESAVVFTEYRDTLFHLRNILRRPVVLLHGGLSREERAAALTLFSTGQCPILLATDAAGEGVNLHHSCRLVINLELPWNPMRLEQRIGRVDRIGQRRTVHAVHLIAGDTGEARILERLMARIARARADIDAPDPIGCEEERAVAKLVIDGAGEGAEPPDPDASRPPAGCVFPRLEREAIAEAARLTDARALTGSGDVRVDVDRTWLARARHRRIRVRLGGRVVLLLQATGEDGDGRVVESTLVPLAVSMASAGRITGGARDLSSLLRRLEEDLARHVDPAVAGWRGEAARTAAAFASTRLQRERAIASAVDAHTPGAVQPGLFDRRVETALAAAAAARRDQDAERRSAMARIDRAAVLSFQPPRLLLALVP
jgi:superfamily II DNA or RNA helicase